MQFGPLTSSSPSSFGATGSPDSRSTTFAAMAGSGWPTLPCLRPPGGCAVSRIRCVDGNHGGHLGAAVAFQQLDPELLPELLRQVVPELLGADDHMT